MRVNRVVLCLGWLLLWTGNSYAAPKAKAIEFWNDNEPGSVLRINHTSWQSILDKYLDDTHSSGINLFNYAAVSAGDRRKLDQYLEYLQQMDPRQVNIFEQKAYWINLYNAAVVSAALNAEVEDSIREAGNIWKRDRFLIARQELSLDDILHGILRPIFKDTRLHFALSTASLGGPNLQKKAFLAENVQQLLDKCVKDFINNPRGMTISEDKLLLSTIFKSYREDFGDNNEGLKAYLKQHVAPEVARRIDATDDIDYEFDWGLNTLK